MITDCPNAAVMPGPSARARMSEVPPGGYGTMILIGFEGHACARAAVAKASAAKPASEWMSRFMVVSVGCSSGSVAFHVIRVKGMARGHVEAVVLRAAEGEVGAALGQLDERERLALRVEHHHAIEVLRAAAQRIALAPVGFNG